jgi:hypothetical protein
MKNFLFSAALALLGWLALSDQASAATITIDPNPIAFFSDSAGSNAAINNAYEFSFTGTADGFFGALSLGISGLTTNICSDAACSGAPLFSGTTVTGPFGLLSLSGGSFTGLLGGTYYVVVSGLASFFGGGYIGGLALNVTAPAVPIPPALLLFATAIAGLGAFKWARRGSAAA